MAIAGRRHAAAAVLALLCLATGPGLAAAAPAPSTCDDRLKVVKARLKKAETGLDGNDTKNSGARKHYKAALSAHRAFDEPTCLSELQKAEAALSAVSKP
jgi:hypothetical protein